MRVTETDIWFKTRAIVLKEQKIQVINLQSNLQKIIQDKLSLSAATNTFHDNLTQFMGSMVVGDKESMVGGVYKHQAEADEELYFLAEDYEKMIEAADRALAVRKEALRGLIGKRNRFEAGKEDHENMEVAKDNFDVLNQTMRRELEHFDTVMGDEFSRAFDDYNRKYEKALNRKEVNQF